MPLSDGVASSKQPLAALVNIQCSVNIEYTTPDGKKETIPQTVKYTVGTPSGASVFLEKMNVLYIGVENPMTISAGSAGLEKMQVGFTNGAMAQHKTEMGVYCHLPTTPGNAKINVDR